MNCEEVRELLPSYVDDDLHQVGAVEVHLASCAGCSADLAVYREMMSALVDLRDVGVEPRPELVDAIVASIPHRHGAHGRRYALASVGGAAVGATAMALVWWRIAHREATP